MEFSSKLPVQVPGIASSQPAVFGNHVSAKSRHLVHITEYCLALGLGQLDRARVEDAESVQREALAYKLLLNQSHDRCSDWHQIGLMDVWNEDRKQGTRVGEQQTFPTVQPDQVGVPILVGSHDGHQVSPAGAQKLQRLGRAPENHAAHGMCRVGPDLDGGRNSGEVVNSFFAMDSERQRRDLPFVPTFIRHKYARRLNTL